MARKTVGYTKLEWTCPNCGGRNPGTEKVCSGCGAAQPPDVKFEQTQSSALITDQAEIEKAKAGADIHCPFCGARNPAGTKECGNCGGDLTGGKQRESGEVVGAFAANAQVKQVPCPACGAPNPENGLNCTKCGVALTKAAAAPVVAAQPKKAPVLLWIGLGIAALLVIICLVSLVFANVNTTQTEGVVSQVTWKRAVVLEALAPVTHNAWQTEVPPGAKLGSCAPKFYGESDAPAPVSTETCGTPYSVDKGNGFSEVVQDCTYQVYEMSCSYSVTEWSAVKTLVEEGNDLAPRWPQPSLDQNQRLGERDETYSVIFTTDKGNFTYITRDEREFTKCTLGSRWKLHINGFGNVVGIEP